MLSRFTDVVITFYSEEIALLYHDIPELAGVFNLSTSGPIRARSWKRVCL